MSDRYIIIEVIPEAVNPSDGQLLQISALKLNGLNLESRFDYRIKEENIKLKDMIQLISYDKKSFKYVGTDKEMLDDFRIWSEGLKLLIIDNNYTKNFLNSLDNEKESIFKYLDLEYSDDVLDKVVEKYNLKPTSYVVDLLYEALIYNTNEKK